MAMKGCMFITDNEGNVLPGPQMVEGRENGIDVFIYNHEVYLPTDPETGMVKGSRRLSPFEVTKEVDKTSPTIAKMVCNGQKCSEVKIALYKIDDAGVEQEMFHFILKNANIVSVKHHMPVTKLKENEPFGYMETIRFLPKEFTWSFKEGGVEYTEKNLT